MAGLGLICVGRLKQTFYAEACDHYAAKLTRLLPLETMVVRDGPGRLPTRERVEREGRAILARLKPGDAAVVLDEGGQRLTSRRLADRVLEWIEAPGLRPVFVVGGPFGLSEAVKGAARASVRLSDLTLPHELARLVLLEQLYRAGTILRHMPYHHD